MCNYEELTRSPNELQRVFGFDGDIPNMAPRIVVRPTDTVHVIARDKNRMKRAVPMRWGLVPPWAKDVKTGLTMFNARVETLLEKSSYAAPFRKGHRALVPLDGFYEFSGPRGAKQPWHFKPRDGRVLAFAGIWESWKGPKDAPLDKPLLSYTIVTTTPNATVKPIHDRMPVLFSAPAQFEAWLDPDAGEDALMGMLTPAPDDLLEVNPVRRDLLKLKDPGPEALAPIDAPLPASPAPAG